MAHFAQIENSIVVNVLVVSNDDLAGREFPESETLGSEILRGILPGTEWKQTSYNGNFRVRYAAIGGTYDAQRDAFIWPQPFDDWLLDEITLDWIPPVPKPTDGADYIWDQGTHQWIVIKVRTTMIGA